MPPVATTIDPTSWGAWLLILVALALAPFLLTMVTSFVKIVIVASLVRTALGTPQIPPAIVINGLAMVLTVHIMWPVGETIHGNYNRLAAERRNAVAQSAPATAPAPAADSEAGKSDSLSPGQTLEIMLEAARDPMMNFLRKHASPRNVALFRKLHDRRAGVDAAANPSTISELAILIPAFVLTELTLAFQIGFLIFLPFVIVDLVVSNVLLAIGAQSLQPTLVSLPLKLLLFVVADGWTVILRGLIQGYA